MQITCPYHLYVLNRRGVVTGAIIGGIDSGLGGNDIKQVLHDALMGAGIGAIGACFLPELLCLVTSCVPKLIALKGMSYLVLLSGGLGVAESLNEGNGKQALFRGIIALGGFIGFSKLLNDIKFVPLKRVGRWMSKEEYIKMVDTGKVQMSPNGNTSYVADPADIDAFGKQAKPGSIYVEFDVDSSRVYPAGKKGWGQIPGPGSLIDRLNIKKGFSPFEDMPNVFRIKIRGEK